MPTSLFHRCTAEAFGTFWLVFGGCGAAVFACTLPGVGIGYVGVSLAFGLTVLTMAYAIGHISGCHLNPAVSIGLYLGKRFPAKDLLPYIVAQVVGGTIGAGILHYICTGQAGYISSGGFASNGYGANMLMAHSPNGYSMAACFVAESLLTFFFLMIILGSTDQRAAKGFAPLAIGLGLTLIHLISIPITNTSVNPARSTAAALFSDPALGYRGQLWLFWLAPIIGAAVAGIFYNAVLAEREVPPVAVQPLTFEAK
jgi:aquaporin Z